MMTDFVNNNIRAVKELWSLISYLKIKQDTKIN